MRGEEQIGASPDGDRATRAGTEPRVSPGLGLSAGIPCAEVFDELTRQASDLERYPFESATMNEAARMAASAIRNIRRNLMSKWAAE